MSFELLEQAQSAINRMSNHGMTIKTAGLTFFGVAVTRYLYDESPQDRQESLGFIFLTMALISTFNFVEFKYLESERKFIYIANEISAGRWTSNFLDLSHIKSLEQKPKELQIWAIVTSFSLWPFWLFETLCIVGMLLIA